MTKKLFTLLILCSLPLVAQSPSINLPGGSVSASDVIPGLTPYIDVRSKKAVCDGITDDTVAVQAAATAAGRSNVAACGQKSNPATQNCSSVVFIPAFCVVSQIVMPSRVTLAGAGWQTSGLIQKAQSNKPMIVVADPATTERVSIRNLFINGNKTNQTGSFDCIVLDSAGGTGDRYHEVRDLYMDYCGGKAISVPGASWSASHFQNIWIRHSGGNAIYSNSYDNWFDIIDVGMNGKDGIYFDNAAGNNHLGTTKTWYNHGFGVADKSNRLHLDGVEAQDNYSDGFDFEGDNITGTALSANGNGKTGAGTGFGGYKINGATNSHIEGIATNLDEGAGTLTQDFGISFAGTNTNNTINLVSSKENVADVSGTISLADCVIVNGKPSGNCVPVAPPAVVPPAPILSFGFDGFPGTSTPFSGPTNVLSPAVPITVLHVDINASAAPLGCVTFPQVAVYVNNVASACSYTFASGSLGTSLDCSVPAAAKQPVTVQLQTAGVSCTGNLGTVWATLQYKAQ